METTFMTIHNLSSEATILFASESIVDVLGYQPFEVVGKSSFDYFHPDEVPFARYEHHRTIQLDKASVLHYSRIKSRNAEWVSCECVFSVVHDHLVACTSIYKQSMSSEKRRLEAPQIRRIFACSPRDPRYHMLEHLSARFRTAPQPTIREPRAAMIINRFSRELNILYSTDVISSILGVTADELHNKSFYECIAEDCLPDAIRTLESAKANDSIAYLRFRCRDPRRDEDLEQMEREASHSDDSEDGGVPIDAHMITEPNQGSREGSFADDQVVHSHSPESSVPLNSNTDSGGSTDHDEIFDHEPHSSVRPVQGPRPIDSHRAGHRPALELEAVISCTSDGLVVILRRARPALHVSSGIFAAPWGIQEIVPQQASITAQGLSAIDFMSSIRDVAVFAWSLTGINGKIANYAHGIPRGEAVPPTGFPIWDVHAQDNMVPAPENQAKRKWEESHDHENYRYGEYRGWKERTMGHGREEQASYQYPHKEMRFREQDGSSSPDSMDTDGPRGAAMEQAGGLFDGYGNITPPQYGLQNQNSNHGPHFYYGQSSRESAQNQGNTDDDGNMWR